MKQYILIALTCLSINSFSQTKNYYITIGDTTAVGLYSTRSGLMFTEELDEAVMENIKSKFKNDYTYFVRLNWKLEDFNFENEYYSFDRKGNFLKQLMVDEVIVDKEDIMVEEDIPITFSRDNQNYIKIASSRYLLSEGVAIGGSLASLALSQDDPGAAASVLAVSSILSYCIRISGHIALGKQNN